MKPRGSPGASLPPMSTSEQPALFEAGILQVDATPRGRRTVRAAQNEPRTALKRADDAPATKVLAFRPMCMLAKITRGKSRREYRQTQGVYAQGDAADAVFY